MTGSKTNKSNSRWLDIISYALFASILVWIAFFVCYRPYVEFWLEIQQKYWANYNHILHGAYVGFIVSAIFFSAKNYRTLPVWLGFRHFYRFPPLWFASLITSLIMGGVTYFVPAFDNSRIFSKKIVAELDSWFSGSTLFCTLSACFVLAPLIFGLVAWICQRFEGPKEHQNTDGTPANATEDATHRKMLSDLQKGDDVAFKHWLGTDEELNSEEFDIADHTSIASRIFDRLKKPIEYNMPDTFESVSPCRDKPSVALIGEKGSGKSSICNLVQKSVERKLPNAICVRVSMWSYNETLSAVNGVLNGIAAVIKTQVSPLQLNRIPSKYIQAIEPVSSKGAKFAKAINSFFGADDAPEEVLKNFAEILDILNMEVVVIVEDMERYLDRGGTENKQQNHDLGPINAMLYWLDRQQRIHLLFATDIKTAKEIDVLKVVKHMETIPKLKREYVYELIRAYRRKVKNDSASLGYISLRYPPSEDQFPWTSLDAYTLSTDVTPTELYKVYPDDTRSAVSLWTAITSWLGHPRHLKAALRHCSDSWSGLKGELDFDTLLILCAIRATHPQSFIYMTSELDGIRRDLKPLEVSEHKQFGQVRRLGETLQKESPFNALEFEALMKSLFLDKFVVPNRNNPAGIQRLASSEPTDYMDRFLRGRLLPDEQTDQPFLQAIEQWKTSSSHQLVKLFDSTDNLPLYAKFLCLLSGEELKELLNQVMRMFAFMSFPLDNLKTADDAIWEILDELRSCDLFCTDDVLLPSFEKNVKVAVSKANPVAISFLLSPSQLNSDKNSRNPQPASRDSLVQMLDSRLEKQFDELKAPAGIEFGQAILQYIPKFSELPLLEMIACFFVKKRHPESSVRDDYQIRDDFLDKSIIKRLDHYLNEPRSTSIADEPLEKNGLQNKLLFLKKNISSLL